MLQCDLVSGGVNGWLQSAFSADELYPDITPYKTEMVPVSKNHTLYVEQSGREDGFPVIVFHGGPGGGSSPMWRRFFDPNFWRIVVFDQPGCGKSTYTAGNRLVDNLIFDLAGYVETIRKHLRIDRWAVYGGSWGSTVALTYAILHPEAVVAEMMRGIFMGRACEIEWFYGATGARNIFPEMWDRFVSAPGLLPEQSGEYYVREYRKLLQDPVHQCDAARRWSQWEEFCDHFRVDPTSVRNAGSFPSAMDVAVLENWYFLNRCGFPSDSWIFDNLHRIRHIPATFVSARYDSDCPKRTAWELHKAWPEAEMVSVHDANHVQTDPKVTRALRACTDYYAFRIGGGLSAHS